MQLSERAAVLQLLHDLKAPLTALKVLRSRPSIGENENALLNLTLIQLEKLLSQAVGDTIEEASELHADALRQLVGSLVAQFQLTAGEGNIVLHNHTTTGVCIKPTAFKRALSNILDNAVRACRLTGGTVYVTLETYGHEVHIHVRDEGPGFGYDDSKRSSHRWGMGLKIVEQLVSQVGGRLEINSESGRGSQVSLILRAKS